MTCYAEYRGKIGDAERYILKLDQDRIEAIVGNGDLCLRMNGEVLDPDLTLLVIEEMRDLVSNDKNGTLLQETNRVLERLGLNDGEASEDKSPSPNEIMEIKVAFRNWSGVPSSVQSRVLSKCGLEYYKGNGHPRIRKLSNPNNFITVSSSPSDGGRVGKNIATDIINHLLTAS